MTQTKDADDSIDYIDPHTIHMEKVMIENVTTLKMTQTVQF